MKNLECVIFDMDGVIFDTEKYYLNIWVEVFKKRGINLDKNIYISLMGTGRANVMKVYKENYGENLPMEEMYKEKDEMLLNAIREGRVPIKDGAEEILSFLKENNIKTALATSSRRERLNLQISMYDIFKKFDAIVCGEDIVSGKPAPEIFLKAAEKVHVKPENCIVVEDSLAGIKGAYAGKMCPIHVKDLRRADSEILKYAHNNFENLNEIQNYISENYIK